MWYCTGCDSEVEDDCVTYWEQHDPMCGGCNATCVPERPPLSEKDAKIENLRDQLAEMRDAEQRRKAQIDLEKNMLRAQLADCRAVLREAGHLPQCDMHPQAYDYQGRVIANPKCTCGYARVMGEG